MDWSSDGRFVVYRVTSQGASNDIMVLPMTTGDRPTAAGQADSVDCHAV